MHALAAWGRRGASHASMPLASMLGMMQLSPTSDDVTSHTLEEPSLPLTRATLHRANSLPALVPLPLWTQGGPRAAWGWQAPDGHNSRYSASRGSDVPSTAAHGPRSTLVSSAGAQRHVSHGRQSGALDSTSSVRDSGTDSEALSYRGQASACSSKPTPWEAQRIRELMRKPSLSPWDLGWGPEASGTAQTPAELALPPPVQSPMQTDVPHNVQRPLLRRAMTSLSAEQALEYYESSLSRRRHRFSRALRLAIEARPSWRDTHGNAAAGEERTSTASIPGHASPSQLLAPRALTRQQAQRSQAPSHLMSQIWNWMLPNGLGLGRAARGATLGRSVLGARGPEEVRV